MEPDDTFEISLRIMNTEIVGMKLASKSRAKNWVAFCIVGLVVLIGVSAQAVPAFKELIAP